MSVSWIPHRFAGGVLALDTANTVVLRNDPARTFDRFDDAAEIAPFAEAASTFRSTELGGRRLAAPDPYSIRHTVLAIRETTDRALRSAATGGFLATSLLEPMLRACAQGLRGKDCMLQPGLRPFGDPATPIAFEAALAVSALSLLPADRLSRIRICGNCCWLFLDLSRNSSRLWCDMAVCGNRQKAKRHYRRRKKTETEHDHVH
jgi:predicted RNA-binding Zn ribbon-like protein